MALETHIFVYSPDKHLQLPLIEHPDPLWIYDVREALFTRKGG